MSDRQNCRLDWGGLLRRLAMAWLTGALAGYSLLSPAWKTLAEPQAAAAVSLPLAGAAALVMLALLTWLGPPERNARRERWLLFGLVLALLGQSCFYIRTPEYLWAAGILTALTLAYALGGRSAAPPLPMPQGKRSWPFLLPVVLTALAAFAFLAAWGLSRVDSYGAPTYDFGIFAQMFHKMSVTGQPLTTLERDGLLSHFAVHLSPIWYLLLPFWLIWPRPELLPILQVLVLGGLIYALYYYEPQILTVLDWKVAVITASVVLLFGIIITTLCANISVNKFLKMTAGDLYKI